MIGGALLSGGSDSQQQQQITLPVSNYQESAFTQEEKYVILRSGLTYAEIVGPSDCADCDSLTFSLRQKMGEYDNLFYVSRIIEDVEPKLELSGLREQKTVKLSDPESKNQDLVDDFICANTLGVRPEKCILRKL